MRHTIVERFRVPFRLFATLILLSGFLAASAPNSALASSKEVAHCVGPTGLDFNEFYGISAQVVAAFCDHANAGQQWVAVPGRWFVGQTFEIIPEGFVASGDTPLEDFVAKFLGVRYLVDAGTAQEQSYTFQNLGQLFVRSQFDLVLISPITLGIMYPLSIGDHVVTALWSFSAMHCDGLGDVVDENCLPAGETEFTFPISFRVIAGHS